MNHLQIIEQNSQRVLTTAQLAESYGTNKDRISANFNENAKRFKEGKHFILLQSEGLKTFKNEPRNSGLVGKNASNLYLWTEKGAWLHAKSLNTDQAWDAYELLVDKYYSIVEQQRTMSPSELALLQAQNMVALEQRVEVQGTKIEALEAKQDNITEIIALNPTEWRKKVSRILSKIAEVRGGYEAHKDVRNESYEVLEERAKCKLAIRVSNKQKNLAIIGANKTAISKVSKLDVIADDTRLTEIYLAVVKEIAIKHQINIEGLGA